MMRKLLAASVAFLFSAAGLVAGEYTGKVKSVDAANGNITILVSKKEEKTFKVAKDAKFTGNKKIAPQLTEGLKSEIFSKAGDKKAPVVTLTTEGEGSKEVVTGIKIGGKKPKENK